MNTGKLIVFEGGEGSGKTTQLSKTQSWLQSLNWQAFGIATPPPVLATREPGGTPLGKKLRAVLLDTDATEVVQPDAELLLYAADRAQHVRAYLQPALAQGAIVLCDRFVDSTIAYQGYGRGLDLAAIAILNQMATGGLSGDLTIWLDVEVAVGLPRARQRSDANRFEAETIAFHERVRHGFQTRYAQAGDRMVRVDADGDIETVFAAVQQIVLTKFADWFNVNST